MRVLIVAGVGLLLTLILAEFWFHSPTKPLLPPVFRGYTNDTVGRRFATFHIDGDRRLLSTVYIIEEFHGRRSIRVGATTNSQPWKDGLLMIPEPPDARSWRVGIQAKSSRMRIVAHELSSTGIGSAIRRFLPARWTADPTVWYWSDRLGEE